MWRIRSLQWQSERGFEALESSREVPDICLAANKVLAKILAIAGCCPLWSFKLNGSISRVAAASH
jgi:hypothetical protein